LASIFSILAFILIFYLASILIFLLACIEVQQCPLRSGIGGSRCRAPSGGRRKKKEEVGRKKGNKNLETLT
jgi:hypothetical protein